MSLAHLLGIPDPARPDLSRLRQRPAGGRLRLPRLRQRPADGRLRLPLGRRLDGSVADLDLGSTPHGLLVGATGSGKSEMMCSVVLAGALTATAEEFAAVLLGFYGDPTFRPLRRLPHVAGVVADLIEDPLADRLVTTLYGELVRRQDLLHRSGTSSIVEYAAARARGVPLEPLPLLLIVCDEFDNVSAARPDMLELFVAVGRLGAALGVHLLLAAQRYTAGRLRELLPHLSYRIGLRMSSALESREFLGIPDASDLPVPNGHGFLRYGDQPPIRFATTHVRGPYGDAWAPSRPDPVQSGDPEAASVLDVLVDALAGADPRVRQLWPSPAEDGSADPGGR